MTSLSLGVWWLQTALAVAHLHHLKVMKLACSNYKSTRSAHISSPPPPLLSQLHIKRTTVPCGVPSPPINGSIEALFTPQEVVYRCDPGFGPSTEMTATCESGNWSPTPADLMCTQVQITSGILSLCFTALYSLWVKRVAITICNYYNLSPFIQIS